MNTKNVIATMVLALSSSALLASPVTHNHGTRTHSHNLPGTGMAHNHGSLPSASFSSNKVVSNDQARINALSSPTRINNDYKRIIAMGTPRNRVSMIDSLSQMQGTLIVGSLVDKYKNKGSIPAVKRDRKSSKKFINSACNTYAKRLQDKDQRMQLNKFSSERCVAKAFKMLSFNNAQPSSSAHSRVKNRIQERFDKMKKEKRNEFNNKLESKLKHAFRKLF